MKFQLRCEHLETRENPSGFDDTYSLPPVDPSQVPPLPAPQLPADTTPVSPPADPVDPAKGW
ncbi:hypothetical protein BH11PLA2_BH11PLA2_18820 [soil metagenome]